MTFGLILLETAAERSLPFPAWMFGVIAFAILVALLLVTLAIGKGRFHS